MIPALRPYQVAAIEQARAHLAAGCRAPVIVGPTGMGKTTIGASIARAHLERGGEGVLWLAHRKELVEQAADRLEQFGMTVGVIAAGSRRVNPFARVQVAMVQTLRARGEYPKASLIIPDEAHHYVAQDWQVIPQAYPHALRVGLTATPERGDGQGLRGVFDCMVVATTVRELTELGFLVPLKVVGPPRALASKEIAQRPVDAYLEHARGRRTIVFAPHVKAARVFLDEFLAAGVRAALVHGELASLERSEILRRYRRGEIDVLVNVNVLTEGFDDPATSCCILARGCGTAGMFIQIVGRILRPAPGKLGAMLIDLRGVVHVHGHPSKDWEFSLDGRAIRQGEAMPEGRLCTVCGAVYVDGRCPDCGRAPNELEAPTVVKVKLEHLRWERLRQDEDSVRVERLAKWFREAQARGFKEGFALNKYRVVYGDWPPWKIKQAAAQAARRAA